MTRPLKVYSWTAFYRGGQVHAVVAETSLAAASRAAEAVKLGKIRRDYCSITRNPYDCEVALAQPGVVFVGEDVFAPDRKMIALEPGR